MATTNRVFIVIAFVLSGIAALFNTVSLSTEKWITARASDVSDLTDTNYINYGLFFGNYKMTYPSAGTYEISITCNFKYNICAMLCGLDNNARAILLDDLYNNKSSNNTDNYCPGVYKYTFAFNLFQYQPPYLRGNSNTIAKDKFINAGVWLSTLIFLSLAMLTGLVATVLALYNTVSNPTQYYLSVKSLFIYNAAALFFTVLYMALWGTNYILHIFHNVAIYDTLVGNLTSDKTAFLGYSYWFGLISLAFYVGSIGILYYREYLNERDPRNKIVSLEADSADPNLYLY
ncbi:uncharacterized protein [Euwallacea fornicatus]|uniref:uncharacterized protein n=1 Tax=Euwallacea fornicatus TaxID=995702 RepID=UPI00338E425E